MTNQPNTSARQSNDDDYASHPSGFLGRMSQAKGIAVVLIIGVIGMSIGLGTFIAIVAG